MKGSTNVLRRTVGEPATEHKAADADVAQSTSNSDLIRLPSDVVDTTPTSACAHNEVLSIGRSYRRIEIGLEGYHDATVGRGEARGRLVTSRLQSVSYRRVLVQFLDSIRDLFGVSREESARRSVQRESGISVDRIDFRVDGCIGGGFGSVRAFSVPRKVLGVLGLQILADHHRVVRRCGVTVGLRNGQR